ncbi:MULTISPECIES: cryptochrome/photolyase family protein [Pseudomonadati]|uniref:Cryptochrome/photolyase family protein n=1 Tax=Shewanella aestuarii TaxID=1028752 RepID=A0ABT0L1E8_9GAMM|nr:cryptochrome/photolyase family protein [Shewanella aestuarii]MCL1117546.1 cryptochrome/photolyase family protein [Shewanella aestuarii]GGN75414.1 deoxyribodipyrimidine photo-lyase [Shewanella aestuarii]
MKSATRLRLVLGDQLNASHSWFREKHQGTLYVIAELHQEASYTKHHAQKISAFFAAMSQFADALEQAGHRVLHLTLDETAQYQDLPALLAALFQRHNVDHFEYQLADEYRLRHQLENFTQGLTIKVTPYETEHFYLKDAELAHYFQQGKKHRLEHFYRKMRLRFNVMMEGDEPLGGQWNFDQQNRQKIKPKDFVAVPEPLLFSHDVTLIWERIQRHNINTIGEMNTALLWPVNRKQSLLLLDYFCRFCLVRFGQFQDAMTAKLDALGESKQWALYHSRLSFALNTKMISPQCVVDTAIAQYVSSEGEISLAQIEGFVRQIIGWREFVRGVYWSNMPEYGQLNVLNADNLLPDWFWNAKTNMNCLHYAIKQSLQYAYAHHIQRLMVTGNFCLITAIDPKQVDDWYLGIYIDAIEWVEMPNTRGMSQFADGGIVGSKAYAASGNYINKMSDYCSDCKYSVSKTIGDNACPLNALYWNFMAKHQQLFSNNPRNKMVFANWQKKPIDDQQAILKRAEYLLNNLHNI